MTVQQSFNSASSYYDQWVRKALPGFDDIFAAALRSLPFPEDAPLRVLDLGAGTGLFSSVVHARYPQAHFVLVDLAEQMLSVAQERLGGLSANFTCRVADIRALDSVEEFDLVVSSLAIHHLEHADKAQLFANVWRALKGGGIFLNVDQVQAPNPTLRELYWSAWLEHVRREGATEEQIRNSIQRRAAYDRDALLADQVKWLAAAGFAAVDVLYKHYFIALFYAQKREPAAA